MQAETIRNHSSASGWSVGYDVVLGQHVVVGPAGTLAGSAGPIISGGVGGDDPEIYEKAKAEGKLNDLPVNRSPQFAPVLHPTLETGAEALVIGALAWLGHN